MVQSLMEVARLMADLASQRIRIIHVETREEPCCLIGHAALPPEVLECLDRDDEPGRHREEGTGQEEGQLRNTVRVAS